MNTKLSDRLAIVAESRQHHQISWVIPQRSYDNLVAQAVKAGLPPLADNEELTLYGGDIIVIPNTAVIVTPGEQIILPPDPANVITFYPPKNPISQLWRWISAKRKAHVEKVARRSTSKMRVIGNWVAK